MKEIQLGITDIMSLKQLRNEIAYVLRNPFLVKLPINDVNQLFPLSAKIP